MPKTFFQGGSYEEQVKAAKPINDLLQSGNYRDISPNIVKDFYSGKTSLEDTVSAIKGTKTFTGGAPLVDTGSGVKPVNIGGDKATGFNAPGQGFYTPEILKNAVDDIKNRVSSLSGGVSGAPAANPQETKALDSILKGYSTPELPNTGRAGESAVSALKTALGASYSPSIPTAPSVSGDDPADLAKTQLQGFQQAAGIDAVQNDLSAAKTDLANFENTILNEADKIKGEAISTTVIGRKLVKLDADTANALRGKQAMVTSATDRLNMANQQISQLVSLSNQNYQNARSSYEFEVNKAFQFAQLFQTEKNKEQTTAQAAITGFINIAKENPTSMSSLSSADKAQWNSWELSAGYPQGYIQGLVGMIGKANNFEYKGTVGDSKSGYSALLYDANTGDIKTVKITGGVSGTDAVAVSVQSIQSSDLPSEEKNNAVLTKILQDPDIGQGTRTSIGTTLGVTNAIMDMATARQTSGFGGISPLNTLLDIKIPFTDIGLIPFRESARSDEGRENVGYIEAINLKVQQWASGAALTVKQTEQVGRFTPTVTDTDNAVKTKLNNLYNFMMTQIRSQLQSNGLDVSLDKVDLFETEKLLQKASPEQLQELKNQGLIKP